MFARIIGASVVLGLVLCGTQLFAQDLEQVKKDVEQIKQDLAAAKNGPDHEQRIKKLEQAVAGVEQIVVNLQIIVTEQLGQSDGTGEYVPRILGNMNKKEVFRKQMNEVAEKVTQGRLVFENFTFFEPIVYVNGSAWRVRQGTSHIFVPRGTVITQRPLQSPLVFDFTQGDDERRVVITADSQLVLRVTQ